MEHTRGIGLAIVVGAALALGACGSSSSDKKAAAPPATPTLALFAGNPIGSGDTDGTGAAASFAFPEGIAFDSAGNLYVADTFNHTIRKVTPAGAVTTFAGTPAVAGSADGASAAASFNQPAAVAVDSAGIVYVADSGNHTIRKIASGTVSTWAGSAGTSGHADGLGSAATFNSPSGIALDSQGNVFVADTNNNTIRMITPAGAVTTFAGSTGNLSGDGTGAAAGFFRPIGLAMDSQDNLFVADWLNNAIRRVTPAAVVTTWAGGTGGGDIDGTGAAATLRGPQGVATDIAGNVYVVGNGSVVRKIVPGPGGINGVVTTLAGSSGNSGSVDGTGAAARFNFSEGVAVDGAGNVFVSDTDNSTLRKVTPAGVVTTFAGSAPTHSGADGTGNAAGFWNPLGIVTDSAGNVYVTDTFNATLRKITPGGAVTTVAGTVRTPGSADGTGAGAQFSQPNSVATDSADNVYVADTANSTIRMITPAGVVTTLAGAAGLKGSADGTGSAARFMSPQYVATDSVGNVYVSDSISNTIRKIAPGGIVTTLAGTPGVFGFADGTGAAASFNGPEGLATDSARNVYVADTNNSTIRMITPLGAVTTLAGLHGSPGHSDGTGSAAQFQQPWGLVADPLSGNLYVGDRLNYAIRQIAPGGVVTTLAGGTSGSADGTGAAAQFNLPEGVAVDGSGNIYVAELFNHTIRKVTPAGVVTTLAGTALFPCHADGTGTAASFADPSGVALDSAGNIYVADTNNHVIRKITPAGVVTTFAGVAGGGGYGDGTGAAACFSSPGGIALDSAGNAYVADTNNYVIRKVTAAGVVTTFAGIALTLGHADGAGALATFYSPTGVATDSAGNLVVADTNNHTIRTITSGGVVSTLAGTAGTSGSTDGPSATALFKNPKGVVTDSAGNVFVADTLNHTIRKVTPAGVVTTLAGTASTPGFADGTAAAARFNQPLGLAIDPSGNLYVADRLNDAVRRVTPGGVVTTVVGSGPSVYGFTPGSLPGLLSSPVGVALSGTTLYITQQNGVAVATHVP